MSSPTKDIVVDTNVIRLYDKPSDPQFKSLFKWLHEHGTLAISQKLLAEYIGIGNTLLAGLINRLIANGRLSHIGSKELKAFAEDRRYRYRSNARDHWHARLVFLSTRKLLVSIDKKLVNDVNGFKKLGGVKPRASSSPSPAFYN